MRVRVHYVSPKGSAELVAGAIASTVKCVKEPLLPAYMPENVRLMFLGCEGVRADKVTLDFIATLNIDRVQHVALFSCGKDAHPIKQMREALTARGIHVLDMTLTAPLRGLLAGGPGEGDLKRARLFAQDCLRSVSG